MSLALSPVAAWPWRVGFRLPGSPRGVRGVLLQLSTLRSQIGKVAMECFTYENIDDLPAKHGDVFHMLNRQIRQITTTRVDSLSFDLFIGGASLVLGFGDG